MLLVQPSRLLQLLSAGRTFSPTPRPTNSPRDCSRFRSCLGRAGRRCSTWRRLRFVPAPSCTPIADADAVCPRKQRNKPKEAPKAPERAPFFLPTLPGTNQRFDFGTEETKAVDEKKNRKLDLGAASVETDFVRRLLKEDPEGECELLASVRSSHR